jgi:effector-binding domain-containing protein
MPRFITPMLIALLIGGASIMSAARAAQEPHHTVVHTAGSIEIRDYAPMILAQVRVAGGMGDASNRGFRPLAGYIFGDNRRPGSTDNAKIAMTTPVMQQQSATIAMTTPVTQRRSDDDGWQVAFVMPQEWSMDTLPRPNDPAVSLQALPARRMAAIRFAGGANEERFEQKTAELIAFLTERGIQPISAPIYARYDPPWMPTPFRRNEVMIEIPADQGGF